MRRLLPVLAGTFLALAPTAAAAPRWSDGPLKNDIQNLNCSSIALGSPRAEFEVGAVMGQYLDDGSPVVGQVFDVRLLVATIGNDCAGTRPKLEIALPPGVRSAVGGANTIRCMRRAASSDPFAPVSTAEGCPSALRPGTTNHPSISGWLSLDPEPGSPAAPAWPLAQGGQLEIHVPVVADRVLNGMGDPSGCACVVGSVQTTNGVSRPEDAFTFASASPQTGPYQHLFVFAGSGSATPETPGTTSPGGPKASLPKSARRAALRAGRVRAKLTGLQRGDRVRVRVVRGKATLAQGRATARRATLTVRLRAGRSAAVRRELRRAGAARVVVSVTRGGRNVPVAATTLRLT
jgi:hypothetical protein